MLVKHTEEVLHQCSIHSSSCHISKNNYGSWHLSQTECFCCAGEPVSRVVGSGSHHAGELSIGELGCIQSLVRPICPCCVEYSLVKDVIVAKIGVQTTESMISILLLSYPSFWNLQGQVQKLTSYLRHVQERCVDLAYRWIKIVSSWFSRGKRRGVLRIDYVTPC